MKFRRHQDSGHDGSVCRPNGFAAQDQSTKCRFPRSALQTSPYDVRKTTKICTTCTYYREILTVRALQSSRTIEYYVLLSLRTIEKRKDWIWIGFQSGPAFCVRTIENHVLLSVRTIEKWLCLSLSLSVSLVVRFCESLSDLPSDLRFLSLFFFFSCLFFSEENFWIWFDCIDKRYRKQGKGKFSQGKGGTKTWTTVALDRVCVRVWRRHVWPCMCACICQESVYVKEKMCMHTAVRCWQLSKNKTMPWLNYGGGGGGLCKVESLKSAEKWQCSSVFKMESRKLPPCSTEAMVGRPKDRQRELRPDSKRRFFGDYNHARLEVSWITSTRGLLLRGYTGWSCRSPYSGPALCAFVAQGHTVAVWSAWTPFSWQPARLDFEH